MRWWAAGLSVMATQISAITFVGTTGQAYTKGMSFVAFYFGLPFAMIVLSLTLVPFFYRAGVFTAYQYLERRFDSRTRTLTSLLFLLSRGLSVGRHALRPLARALRDPRLERGPARRARWAGPTIVYVVYGGNRSVIWTDVVQMALIWFGIFLCVGRRDRPAARPAVGLRDALALAQATGRLETMDPSPDLSRPYTLWSGLIGGMFLAMAYFGCDQSQVQRYLSGRTLTESRLSLLFNAFLKVPMQFLILLTGRPRVRLLPLPRDAAPLEPGGAREARGEGRPGRPRPGAGRGRGGPRRPPGARPRPSPGRATGAATSPRRGRRTSRAQRRLEAAEGGVRRLASEVAGEPVNDVNYIFPSYVVVAAAGRPRRPHHRRDLRRGDVDPRRRAQLARHGDDGGLLQALRPRGRHRRPRPPRLARLHRLLGPLRGAVALQAGPPRLRDRGREPLRLVLLRLDPRRLRPRRAHPARHRARAPSTASSPGWRRSSLVSRLTSVAFLWYNVVGAVTVFARRPRDHGGGAGAAAGAGTRGREPPSASV